MFRNKIMTEILSLFKCNNKFCSFFQLAAKFNLAVHDLYVFANNVEAKSCSLYIGNIGAPEKALE